MTLQGTDLVYWLQVIDTTLYISRLYIKWIAIPQQNQQTAKLEFLNQANRHSEEKEILVIKDGNTRSWT